MLSIGMFTYSTKPRGSVVHAASLAEALVTAGHDVTLYALAKAGAAFFRPVSCALDLIAAGEAPAANGALVRQRIDEFVTGFNDRPMDHDVFHAQDCLAASALLAAGSRTRGRVARTVHHVDRFDDAYLDACQRRSILQADAVFSVSRMTRREVREQFGRETYLVHNGVDPARFAGVRHCASIRSKHGIPEDATVILSIGGVEPRKNSRRALAAMARVFAREPRIAWVVGGGESIWDHGEYHAAFDRELRGLPLALQSRIVRTGAIADEDLTALYGASDVLLCPSLHEGFGLCVLEAMAARTAVVASAREPFTEYLDETNAVLVDPESVEAIANAVAALVAEPARRERLARAAAGAVARFSWASSAALHVAHYAEHTRQARHTEERSRDA
jgi:glycosyltransferase-like protein